MVLAELNAYVSRPIAPTRRIALGHAKLPCTPAPGMGAVLLAGIVARYAAFLDDDSQVDLVALMGQIERGERVPQPRLRHRFQVDHVGLQPIRYRLFADDDTVRFHIEDEKATPAQHALTAVYGAGTIGQGSVRGVVRVIRRAMSFPGGSDRDLIRFLTGYSHGGVSALADPVLWAMEVLDLRLVESVPLDDHPRVGGSHRARVAEYADQGLAPSGDAELRWTKTSGPSASTSRSEPDDTRALPAGLVRFPTRSEVQRAFRRQLRHSHPDHGAERIGAAQRIAELAEARRILLDH